MGIFPYIYTADMYNCPIAFTLTARIDYGINAGDQTTLYHCQFPGPSNYTDGNNPNLLARAGPTSGNTQAFGFLRSLIAMAHITDGASNTYLVGEEAKFPDCYFNGQGGDDNHGPYTGFENDSVRTTGVTPLQDTPGVATDSQFGSVHAGSFNMSFCDGSVRGISYSIDPVTHDHLGNRADGVPVDPTKY